MTWLTAAEAARALSDTRDRVGVGEETAVTRGDAVAAAITSARARSLSAGRFRRLFATAPAPDAGFVDDVRALRRTLPSLGA